MKKYYYALFALIRFYYLKIFKNVQFNFTKLNLIYPFCVFDFEKSSKIGFGYKFTARRNNQIIVRKEAELIIGDNVFFNSNCVLVCQGHILIGNNCKFGPGTMLFDHDHSMQDSNSIVENRNFSKDSISIGEGCWFGAGCIILKGTDVGNHCVFGAGSIIKGKYQDDSIVIQKRQSTVRKWEKYKED